MSTTFYIVMKCGDNKMPNGYKKELRFCGIEQKWNIFPMIYNDFSW